MTFLSRSCRTAARFSAIAKRSDSYRARHAKSGGLTPPLRCFPAGQLHQKIGWAPDAVPRRARRGWHNYACNGKMGKPVVPSASRTSRLIPHGRYHARWYSMTASCGKVCQQIAASEWLFTLSAYNGGQGWVNRIKAGRRKGGWNTSSGFEHVKERVNAGRSAQTGARIVTTPKRFLYQHAPRYLQWGRLAAFVRGSNETQYRFLGSRSPLTFVCWINVCCR